MRSGGGDDVFHSPKFYMEQENGETDDPEKGEKKTYRNKERIPGLTTFYILCWMYC